MTNIILCGGSGSRLWPLSTPQMPKQFCHIASSLTLFEENVLRNRKIADRTIVVANRNYALLAMEQLKKHDIENAGFVLEPIGRNTAPAIALACMELDPDQTVIVTPSDHIIRDTEAYINAVNAAVRAAEDGSLVTFGLHPDYPETGYGYIESGENDGKEGLPVLRFHEKPDAQTAKEYCANPHFLWNSGIFCFKAGGFLSELKKTAADIFEAATVAYDSAKHTNIDNADLGCLDPQLDCMKAIRAESIDYAVLEKSERVRVIPCSLKWSDLGSFDALYGILSHDENGNTVLGDCVSIDSKGNLVIGRTERKIAIIGLDNCIIADTDDGLLVARRCESQRVKEAAEEIQRLTGGKK